MIHLSNYPTRRKRLMEQVKSGVILLLGNNDSPINFSSNAYPFRQDSNFLYFIGLDIPGLHSIIDIDQNREIVFGNEMTVDDRIWMGAYPSLKEQCEAVGITDVRPIADLEGCLQDYSSNGAQFHLLPPYRAEHKLLLHHYLGVQPHQTPESYVSESLIRAIVAQRSYKSDDEIQEIETALKITEKMQFYALQEIRPKIKEQRIAGKMEGIAIRHGSRLAFPTIFSMHGQYLHNPFYGNMIEEWSLVINDCGAESPSHYAGDITRTLVASGQFTQQQKEIYKLVLNTQVNAIEAIKPGIPYRDIHHQVCIEIATGLKALGLMKGDVEEAVNEGAHALFFPHGLGHMMGLDVHDMESLGEDYVGYTDTIQRSSQFGLRSLRLARELEEGFVITVEPGIYFIPDLIDLWQSQHKHMDFIQYDRLDDYRDFGGIRIEDDVLVTEKNGRLLGPYIPKAISEIECF